MFYLISSVGRATKFQHVRQNRARLPDDLGSRKYVLLDSGTSALALALIDAQKSSGIASGGEVIIPAYCCPSILSAVRFADLTPVLVDFEPSVPRIDLRSLRDKLSKRTVAVVAVNFMGLSDRLKEIQRVLGTRKVSLVEDACQSIELRLASEDSADYRVTSYGRGKPHTLLHGGVLQAKTDINRSVLELIEESRGQGKIYNLKLDLYNFSRNPNVFWLVKLLGLAGKTKYRELTRIATMWPNVIEVIARLNPDCPSVQKEYVSKVSREIAKLGLLVDLVSKYEGAADRFLLRYPILIRDNKARDRLLRSIARVGIDASSLYGGILSSIAGTPIQFQSAFYPNAQNFAERLITLPLHAEVTEVELMKAINVLSEFDAKNV